MRAGARSVPFAVAVAVIAGVAAIYVFFLGSGSGGGSGSTPPQAGSPQKKDEYVEINRFFSKFRPKKGARGEEDAGDAAAAEEAEEVLQTTTGGRYFDSQIKMDGVVREHPEGRADAVLTPIFSSSHATNLCLLPSGDLLVAWFSGEDEGGDGISIVLSRLEKGSDRWTKPAVVSVEAGRSAQNPVMFYDEPSGRLTLLHTSQVAFMGQGTSEVRHLHSQDGGRTWTDPEPLFQAPGAFTKNNLLRSYDGKEWMLPMYYTPDGFFEHSSQYSSIQRSTDGLTWKEDPPMEGTLGRDVQPSIIRLDGQKLRCFYRSRDADWVHYADSQDDGRTWSKPRRTKLPNNNSGIQAAMLASGHVALVFNNLQGDHARWPLSVALSEDGGLTWPYVRDLEPAFSNGGHPSAGEGEGEGEYSYPSIVQDPSGSIHIAWTFRRETVRYSRVSEEWIREGKSAGMYKGGHASHGRSHGLRG